MKDIANNQADAPRLHRRRSATSWLLLLYDLLLFCLVEGLLLFLYRGNEPITVANHFIEAGLLLVFLVPSRFLWKIYRQIWRYGGIQSYIRLMMADGCAAVCYMITASLLPITQITFARRLSVCCMCLLASLAIRMCYRYAYKCCRQDTPLGHFLSLMICLLTGNHVSLDSKPLGNKIRVAIVGAGRVGVTLAEELLNNASAAYTPCLFIDISREKIGRQIYNLPVIAPEEATRDTVDHYGIQEVIIAMPQKSVADKNTLYQHYKALGCKVKLYDYPTTQQAVEGRRTLREFEIEDLLFRRPIEVTDDKAAAFYRDKVILITGGGGSIGSELCRQVAKLSPRQLILLDVYENGAYDIQQELRGAYGDTLQLQVEILSVCNRPAMERIFARYRPDIVIHAAAHKHVPLMEHNCCEAVENNVFGTLNVVELSEAYRVQRFMMVSTDKAVNPTNVMGATKRMCEMIVQSHSRTSSYTTFSATRFGNVLGSAGSVIPLFRRQLAAGGPLTLTDKRIVRYFMTIPEASQLVLQSGAMAKNGELFVLDMGRPIQIYDLAINMIRLSGLEPETDIRIVETGLRPGEKLYEELLVKTKELDKTENDLIFVERDEPISADALQQKLSLLREALQTGDDSSVKLALREAVPTFRSPEDVNVEAIRSAEMQAAQRA